MTTPTRAPTTIETLCPCQNGKLFLDCHGKATSAVASIRPPTLAATDNVTQAISAAVNMTADSVRSAPATPANHVPVPDVLASMTGLGFERVQQMNGSTWRDSSTVIIVPQRDPFIHHAIVTSWQGLIAPMNQKRAMFICCGDEVGIAYNKMIAELLAHPELSKWKYVLTLETDNLVPADAHLRLLESIELHKYDAVGGLYFTKGDINEPMAYGDSEKYARTGVLDFAPLDIRAALSSGNQIVECNGLAMGCTLYRMDLFRQVPSPWFVSVADIVEGHGPMGFTQDLYFARTAKQMGKRFAVDLRVKVGHMDLTTGVVY